MLHLLTSWITLDLVCKVISSRIQFPSAKYVVQQHIHILLLEVTPKSIKLFCLLCAKGLRLKIIVSCHLSLNVMTTQLYVKIEAKIQPPEFRSSDVSKPKQHLTTLSHIICWNMASNFGEAPCAWGCWTESIPSLDHQFFFAFYWLYVHSYWSVPCQSCKPQMRKLEWDMKRSNFENFHIITIYQTGGNSSHNLEGEFLVSLWRQDHVAWQVCLRFVLINILRSTSCRKFELFHLHSSNKFDANLYIHLRS